MLAIEEVQRRVAQFTARGLPVLVTSSPLFTQKAQLVPGSTFVVGHDTAIRLVMVKYYDDSHTQVRQVTMLRKGTCHALTFANWPADRNPGMYLHIWRSHGCLPSCLAADVPGV
jgi:hypothetical protein